MAANCNHSTGQYFNECLEAMRADGARITKARKTVISCLSNANSALTPHEIMNEVLKEDSEGVDLASIYRILKYLKSLGLVHQVGADGGFFPCTHRACGSEIHLLTRCHKCDKTEELHLPTRLTSSLLDYLNNEIDFKPENHMLEIKGMCKVCTETDNN